MATDNEMKLGTLGTLVGAAAALIAVATAFALVVWNIATLADKVEALEHRATERELYSHNIPSEIAQALAANCNKLFADLITDRNNVMDAQKAGKPDQTAYWTTQKAVTVEDMRNLGCAPPATVSERKRNG
jgi:hypothetical protein